MRTFPPVLALLITLLVATGSAADLLVADPWTRALPPVSANGAAFLSLHNTGAEADRLVAVSSPLARMVHLHETRIENGVARMGMVDGLVVAPGERVELAPGGLHLMVMGLEQPLVAGGTLPLLLRFEHAGELAVDVPVLPPDATGPP